MRKSGPDRKYSDIRSDSSGDIKPKIRRRRRRNTVKKTTKRSLTLTTNEKLPDNETKMNCDGDVPVFDRILDLPLNWDFIFNDTKIMEIFSSIDGICWIKFDISKVSSESSTYIPCSDDVLKKLKSHQRLILEWLKVCEEDCVWELMKGNEGNKLEDWKIRCVLQNDLDQITESKFYWFQQILREKLIP